MFKAISRYIDRARTRSGLSKLSSQELRVQESSLSLLLRLVTTSNEMKIIGSNEGIGVFISLLNSPHESIKEKTLSLLCRLAEYRVSSHEKMRKIELLAPIGILLNTPYIVDPIVKTIMSSI